MEKHKIGKSIRIKSNFRKDPHNSQKKNISKAINKTNTPT